jgi:MoCo/4Fe-4S cofactor protein with predicted Tat translocation signal
MSQDHHHDHHHSNLHSIREQLEASNGKDYWRSLEELSGTKEFQELLYNEFPAQASEWQDPVSRRGFLKLMGASLALAGIGGGCVYQPQEKIVPYVKQPEELVPGKPLYYATAMPLSGVGMGLLVKSNEGRPTKVEGNPDHPFSFGATDVFSQASILTLYDPDRSRSIMYRGEARPWSAFLESVRTVFGDKKAKQGEGIRILTEVVTSPTLADQLKRLTTEYPGIKWHQYEPVGRGNATLGAQQVFGQPVNTIYKFDQAKRVLSLDSDFLSCGPSNLKYARDFITNRKVEGGKREINRLYVVESTPTNTGAVADHRLALRPTEIEGFARTLAKKLGAQTGPATGVPDYPETEWLNAVVKDLNEHKGASIVIAGDEQPPVVHALAHSINSALGNIGKTLFHSDPIEANPVDTVQSIRELVQDIDAGKVDALIILGGNPVYTAPADLGFLSRLQRVPYSVHLSLYNDETSEYCHWHVPEAYYLESWGDIRAADGTVSIIQPLIAPLYGGRTPYEIIAAFSDQSDRTPYNIVRDYWNSQNQSGDFEKFWRRAVHTGYIPDTAFKERSVSLNWNQENQTGQQSIPNASPQSLEIVFRADPSIYDGRFANNGWLQELPKPITKLTWDNAILISPNTAKALGLANVMGTKGGDTYADLVELEYQGRKVRGPVWITAGHPDNTVTVHLGYGRTRAGKVGNKIGFNAYAIRPSTNLWQGVGAKLTKVNDMYSLASTQTHFAMEGRDVVRSATIEQYLKEDHDIAHGTHTEPSRDLSLYPAQTYAKNTGKYAWGMAIDLSSCVGCNACVVACQAENNIPVVGKEQVARSREMHWLRVDRYYKGTAENPGSTHFMPVPCMHCENAPCEPVCPVAATVHSPEGTNDMVYNRCVGTRYCSNNCPYKVRRFNFLLYQDWDTPTYKMMRNPEVSVRSRGVMEKCTYCIQRIQAAKIESEKEGRNIRDGEVVTACQAVCPTEAIVFGDINDPNSRVRKLKDEKRRNYSLLGDLNTQPRTTYLAEIRNTNGEIKA